jgi:hypothetical protein
LANLFLCSSKKPRSAEGYKRKKKGRKEGRKGGREEGRRKEKKGKINMRNLLNYF